MSDIKRANIKGEQKNFMSGLSWAGQKAVDWNCIKEGSAKVVWNIFNATKMQHCNRFLGKIAITENL